jgi:hypothetical protein
VLRRLTLTLAVSLASCVPLMVAAHAAIGSGAASVRTQLQASVPLHRIQYVYGGYNYCFYPNGWHGPGWY